MHQKIGLVIEGGGMKCVYSAGILDAFLDNSISFDYVIGVSAGSANAVSYLAGQKGRNLRFYTTHIHDHEYFGYTSFKKTKDLFNLDYIYTTLTNSDGKDPLDYEKLIKNPTEFELVTTNALTGNPVYFSKYDIPKDDYQLIKASCAIPAACRPRYHNGIPMYDGGLTDPIPVDRALWNDCDKVVVILSKPRNYIKKPEKMKLTYSALCHKYPKVVQLMNERHLTYPIKYNRVFELEREGKAFVFCPDASIEMGTFEMNEESNHEIYNIAMREYQQRSNSLKNFLNH